MQANDLPASRSLVTRYANQTVLAVGAHPDDAEIAVGGTLARLARAGARVVLAVMSVPEPAAVRIAEARQAADLLGCELLFANEPGRRIDDLKHHELVEAIDRIVHGCRPALLLTHAASEFHSDHLTVHHACIAAQRLADFDLLNFHPTMCRPVPVAFHPSAYVDVSSTFEVKMAAIAAHASQFGARALSLELFRDHARLQGRMIGARYAEALHVSRLILQ